MDQFPYDRRGYYDTIVVEAAAAVEIPLRMIQTFSADVVLFHQSLNFFRRHGSRRLLVLWMTQISGDTTKC